jgi:signal transduction histidine kinase/ActR/RegA family two-component response regulator
VVRGDGTPAMVRMSAGPIRDASGAVIAGVAVFEDVTRQRSLEAQLLQSQKLEAVGQLAGGVAHDFNNLLTAIFGHLDIILVDLPADSPIRDDVVEVRRAAERAARLTRQLLSFSRKQILQPRAVAINAVIGEAEQMLRRVIGETVEVRVHLASDAGNVLVDPLQIGQILLNLVLNARDAMPSGGVVEISTANATITADEPARAPGIIPGEYVTITVRDNGTGIDPDTLAHIFEPFFTTKGVGKGTGLGLATVYGIVRQSRGFVGVESAPNEGSAFTVYLPRIDSAASREEAPAPSVVRPRGSETILLAEDDPTVRAALRRALEQSGYRVLEAQHGADALRVYAAHGDAIDLVITDAVMPELGGLELRRRLHAERPTLPVLVVSGYSDVRATEREDIGESFLAKPFDSETLLARLRQLLARVRTQIGEVGGAGA